MEAGRAQALGKRSGTHWKDKSFHADAFTLTWRGHVSLLYLNPPYDHDPEYGRSEHRFLIRFTDALAMGGALIFVVPHHALAVSSVFLARHYEDISCFRFPGDHYAAYRQVVLVGRRGGQRLAEVGDANVAAQVERWARSPEELPELALTNGRPVLHLRELDESFEAAVQDLDIQRISRRFLPGTGLPIGTDQDLGELVSGRVWPVAMPPKAAHIAMALSSGVFNGQILEPDHPGLPVILAKGMARKVAREINAKTNRKGKQTASVQADQLVLDVTILDRAARRAFKLQPGVKPSGSTNLSQWTIGDVLEGYRGALVERMGEMFPALHDPRRPDGVQLPKLRREPFKAQKHAILAALKILGTGRHPIVMMETGTGKSQVALSVREALAPENHPQTTADLRALGLSRQIPAAGRTMIACPPHLVGAMGVDGWINEINTVCGPAAVINGDQAETDPEVLRKARVRIVEVQAISDLRLEADFYVVSRETLKLGHAVQGLAKRCPKCYAPVREDADKNARRRLRCDAQRHRPIDTWAKLAERLAVALLPAYPKNLKISRFLRGRILQLRTRRPAGAMDHAGVVATAVEVYQALVAAAKGDRSSIHWDRLSAMIGVFRDLAHGLERESLGAAALDRLGRQIRSRQTAYSNDWRPGQFFGGARSLREGVVDAPIEYYLVKALEDLSELGRWEHSEPCGEPLFGADAEGGPRRYPLARYIVRFMPDRFNLFVLDEIHEAGNKGTAQQKALHRLARLGPPVLALTGTLSGGYASSLFQNLHALSPSFRSEFSRGDVTSFVRKYGLEVVEVKALKGVDLNRINYGSRSDREQLCSTRRLREAPDIMPSAILRYVLPQGLMVHIEDLEELPAKHEETVLLEVETEHDRAVHREYWRILEDVLERVRQDRFVEDRAGKLFGALAQMGSYLDRAALKEFEVCYPDGEHVTTGSQLNGDLTVKERYLVQRLRAEIDEGRRVIVYLRHTGSGLPQHLIPIIREHVTPGVVFLDSKKVPARRRQEWIHKEVNLQRADVLIANPVAVATGINNLATNTVEGLPGFSTAICFQEFFDARIFRQACDGRLLRIGTENEVRIVRLGWADSTQEHALDLLSKKVESSRRVDGLSAGANEEDLLAALAIGQAIAQRLQAEVAA